MTISSPSITASAACFWSLISASCCSDLDPKEPVLLLRLRLGRRCGLGGWSDRGGVAGGGGLGEGALDDRAAERRVVGGALHLVEAAHAGDAEHRQDERDQLGDVDLRH